MRYLNFTTRAQKLIRYTEFLIFGKVLKKSQNAIIYSQVSPILSLFLGLFRDKILKMVGRCFSMKLLSFKIFRVIFSEIFSQAPVS